VAPPKKEGHISVLLFFDAAPQSNCAPHTEGVADTVRIRRPKIDKLACQVQGVRIFAKGEILGGTLYKLVEL